MPTLAQEFKDLESPFVVLMLVKAASYMSSDLAAMSLFSKDSSKSGIYVSVNKPYEDIKKLLDKNKISTKRLFFVDMISKEIDSEKEEKENCFYIPSPTSLTDLGIVLEETANMMPGKKYLVLDTLSTLLVYNSLGTVEKFAHFITTKIRGWDMDGVIISLEKETSESLKSQLAQFCDKIIST